MCYDLHIELSIYEIQSVRITLILLGKVVSCLIKSFIIGIMADDHMLIFQIYKAAGYGGKKQKTAEDPVG